MSETKDIKITSAEKVKDPRRVEAGKKLGAISKQAKEKKASGNGSIREVESGFQLPNVNPLTAIGAVGVVGMVVYYGYYRHREDPASKAEAVPAQAKQAAPASEAKPKPVLKQLDTLD